METKNLKRITTQQEYEGVVAKLKSLYGSHNSNHQMEFTRLFRLTEEFERPMMQLAHERMLRQNAEPL